MWKPAEADSFVYDLEGPTGIQKSCTGHRIGGQSFGNYSDGFALEGLNSTDFVGKGAKSLRSVRYYSDVSLETPVEAEFC